MDSFERLQLIDKIIRRYATDRFGYEDFLEDFRKFNPELYKEVMQQYGGTVKLSDDLSGVECSLVREAMKELLEYMTSDESKIRLDAMKVFTRIQSEVSHVDIESYNISESERTAWTVKDKLNTDKYWKVAVKAMGDEEPKIRELAKNAVKEFSWRVTLPNLYRLLENENTHIRQGAGEALAEIFWNVHAEEGFLFEEYMKYLLKAAGLVDEDAREKIVSEIGSLGEPYFTDVFAESLRKSPSEWVREYSAEMLGEQQIWDVTFDALLDALEKDDSPRVRRAVAKTMGELDWLLDPEDMPSPEENPFTYPLIKALGDKDKDVREAALEAIGRIGVEESFVVKIAEALRASMKTESKKDLKLVEVFFNLLDSDKPYIRRLAILSLGYLADTMVIDTLKSFLNDKQHAVQEAAKKALQMIDKKKNRKF
ncbi:MAG: HEAT repeat domain-containing protein [Candidatus Lokiarchaeia archaeon]